MRLASIVISVIVLAGCTQSVTTITINQTVFAVWVADDVAEQTLGLGDIESLEPNQGMLFVFPDAQVHTFWMKGVEYPIDIIWMNNNKVVGSVTAYPGDELYISPQPVDMVLEISAGTVVTEQIGVGDNVVVDE